MSSKVISTVLADIDKIINTWSTSPDFRLADLTLTDLRQKRESLATLDDAVEAKRTELSGMMNNRDDQAIAIVALVTRARSGFRAQYGPNSTQYEQAGGTRTIDRKPSAHRTKKEEKP